MQYTYVVPIIYIWLWVTQTKAKSTKPKQRSSRLFKLPVSFIVGAARLSFSRLVSFSRYIQYFSTALSCPILNSRTGKHNKPDANLNNYIFCYFRFEIGPFYL